MYNPIDEYEKYSLKIGDRKSLYKCVVEKYSIKSALYPASHIDIAPSFIIPSVYYVDFFKGSRKFFQFEDIILEYIENNKDYKEKSSFEFFFQDYWNKIDIKDNVDMIISQYGGFCSRDTKYLLKSGGILLCNDSHGDATIANFDDDFLLIAVVRDNKIDDKKLEDYFQLSTESVSALEYAENNMKEPKYKKRAQNYIFRKK